MATVELIQSNEDAAVDDPSSSQPESTSSSMQDTSCEDDKLSDTQLDRMERNRQKALLLKQARLSKRPHTVEQTYKFHQVKVPRAPIDTGGGFLLDDEEVTQRPRKITHEAPPLLGEDVLLCVDCDKEFAESYLLDKFDYAVCDPCRDPEEKHAMITRSVAKDTYLLKDGDIDIREPPLKYLLKKNPRNDHWGDMKLYLECQISERALEVWGSEEKIEEQRETRVVNREKLKQKRFDKKVKELRKTVRSSLWKKSTGPHVHEYGPESYDEESDEYSKTCTSCGHSISYEKM